MLLHTVQGSVRSQFADQPAVVVYCWHRPVKVSRFGFLVCTRHAFCMRYCLVYYTNEADHHHYIDKQPQNNHVYGANIFALLSSFARESISTADTVSVEGAGRNKSSPCAEAATSLIVSSSDGIRPGTSV